MYNIKFSSSIKNEDLFSISYHFCAESLSELVNKGIITNPVKISIARNGITAKHLRLAFERDINGLTFLFEDRKIPKKSAQAVAKFFSDEE